jgi:DNA-binding NarL/FixJ family response regulator
MSQPMRDPIRVLLVDDHPALRVGLRVLLDQADDIYVVGEAGDTESALHAITCQQPDVVVLDCQLPGSGGVSVAKDIQEQGRAVRVLALSSYADDGYVRSMVDAGAVGYLLKDEAPSAIVAAVRAAALGQTWFSPAIERKIDAWERGELPGGLTERELEVLSLVADGLSNKQIARQLNITVRTANFHVGNILQKLELASRVEAAIWAKEQGVVP